MSYQTGSCTSTENALSLLETFATQKAGYSVIAGTSFTKQTSETGYNTHWDSNPTKIYRKAGQADIHIGYASVDGANGEKMPPAFGSYIPSNGIIRAQIDHTKSGASFVGSTTSWHNYGETYNYHSALCPDSCVQPAKGATEYHFFTDGNEIHVALKLGPYGWAHFSFGMIGTKFGSWDGGAFFCGTNYSLGGVYPITSQGRNNILCGNGSGYLDKINRGSSMILHIEEDLSPPTRRYGYQISRYGGSDTLRTKLIDIAPALDQGLFLASGSVNQVTDAAGYMRTANRFNGRSIGVPFNIFARDEVTDTYKLCGSIDGVRFVNIENLNETDQVNTDWVVFPAGIRGNSVTNKCLATGNLGLAYKKYSLSV